MRAPFCKFRILCCWLEKCDLPTFRGRSAFQLLWRFLQKLFISGYRWNWPPLLKLTPPCYRPEGPKSGSCWGRMNGSRKFPSRGDLTSVEQNSGFVWRINPGATQFYDFGVGNFLHNVEKHDDFSKKLSPAPKFGNLSPCHGEEGRIRSENSPAEVFSPPWSRGILENNWDRVIAVSILESFFRF